jgi:signal transduction histidine kinase
VFEFTNLVKKEVVLNRAEYDLREILVDYLTATAYRSQVHIEDLGQFPVNEPLFCTAIDNLIRNGLKYNDSPSKLIRIYRTGSFLCIEDNGRGLTREEFTALSKPYARKENQKESGTGLGLNISIAIIEEHGFRIYCDRLETNEGMPVGTKITIRLT